MLDTKNLSLCFGEFVRVRRAMCDLTQAEVAERLGIAQAQYSRIERGLRIVDFPLAVKICEILNTDLRVFLSEYIDM